MVIEFADDDTCTCERYLETITKWNSNCPVEPHRRLALADLERDVVEAAVARYGSRLRTGEIYFEYDDDLDKAVKALLVARTPRLVGALIVAQTKQNAGDSK